MRPIQPTLTRFFLVAALAVLVAACDGIPKGTPVIPDETAERYAKTGGSLLGTPGIRPFQSDEGPAESQGGVPVNAYLWRATLDTLSFMPMAQVDAFGGVIITEWHSLPDAPNEQLKVDAYVLSQDLRANGVRVAVFRRVLDPEKNEWVMADVTPGLATQLEDSILTRARQLRIASNAPQK